MSWVCVYMCAHHQIWHDFLSVSMVIVERVFFPQRQSHLLYAFQVTQLPARKRKKKKTGNCCCASFFFSFFDCVNAFQSEKMWLVIYRRSLLLCMRDDRVLLLLSGAEITRQWNENRMMKREANDVQLDLYEICLAGWLAGWMQPSK